MKVTNSDYARFFSELLQYDEQLKSDPGLGNPSDEPW